MRSAEERSRFRLNLLERERERAKIERFNFAHFCRMIILAMTNKTNVQLSVHGSVNGLRAVIHVNKIQTSFKRLYTDD